jgi:hypothetical protein
VISLAPTLSSSANTRQVRSHSNHAFVSFASFCSNPLRLLL